MTTSNNIKLIGIDLGGTKVNIGLVQGNKILQKKYAKLPLNPKNEWEVINLIIDLIKEIKSNHKISGIGIGVPSILDREKGIIHEVQNIPTWKEVPLASILIKEFGIPVFLDNDANCFTLGEFHFGKAKNCKNLIGLTIGTGMGAGIINNYHLIGDANGGAGEFGMIPYLDGIFEDYCSGKFFNTFYNLSGEEILQLAKQGDKTALEAFEQLGKHLGNAIKTILYAIDPEKIIIGGSIVKSSAYFDASLKKSIQLFSYKETLKNFEFVYSTTPDIAILGATSLYYNRVQINDKTCR
ncbi:MAG: ROK family protein [Flavobacteriaceae bacterium]|nr:ROK family protein [Flavobacteriaceae bacterium]